MSQPHEVSPIVIKKEEAAFHSGFIVEDTSNEKIIAGVGLRLSANVSVLILLLYSRQS